MGDWRRLATQIGGRWEVETKTTWRKPVEKQRQDLGLKTWNEARQVAKTEQAGEGALKPYGPKVMCKVGG